MNLRFLIFTFFFSFFNFNFNFNFISFLFVNFIGLSLNQWMMERGNERKQMQLYNGMYTN